MKTQIIKKAEVQFPKYKVGDMITFRYEVPVQNIGWGYEKEIGMIEKINKVTLIVMDQEGNLWKVNNEDVLFTQKVNPENVL
jgi:hypothetical protein